MNKQSKIFLAGHNGMVGSAIMRGLKKEGYENIVTRPRSELDLTRQSDVESFFKKEKPDFVFIAAAKVGGILANSTYPADFIYQNLMIATNLIHISYKFKVEKLLNLGSSCIYPRDCTQPMKEDCLLTGPLEKTNEAYAIAKISAIKLCKYYNEQYGTNFISVMPTNLYGPQDNYDLETSHVIPALIRKFVEAKQKNNESVKIWGTGKPKREFLHVDDLAYACIFLMEKYNYKEIGDFINIGSGKDLTIKELAELIKEISGYKGKIIYDNTKPDGTPRKLLDVSKINELGWKETIQIKEGLKDIIDSYSGLK